MIDAASHAVIATLTVTGGPNGLGNLTLAPDGRRGYLARFDANALAVVTLG
jgi:hypothetical protein